MQKTFKSIILFVGILVFRLIPVRPPNVEPVLATLMPLSKRQSLLSSGVFALLSIFVYDFLTAGIGSYTYSVALAYFVIAICSSLYFKNRKGTIKNYTIFSIYSILFFDVLTGLVVGPIALGQSFYGALVGQIPFTALHLMGGVLFSIILSPLVNKFLEKDFAFAQKNQKVVLRNESSI